MNHFGFDKTCPLEGQAALMTGGASGIGAAIATIDGADLAIDRGDTIQ